MSIRSWITRLSGWSPIGKSVQIKIDECTYPSLLGKVLLAEIISLNEGGEAVLYLIEPTEWEGKTIHIMVAHPRHKGYGFFHVRFGEIAAYFSFSLEGEISNKDTRFASGLIKLVN